METEKCKSTRVRKTTVDMVIVNDLVEVEENKYPGVVNVPKSPAKHLLKKRFGGAMTVLTNQK